MQIQTTYTVDKVKHISCWSDLEILCENGDKIVVSLSTEDMKNLADRLLSRVRRNQEQEIEKLQEALNPTELIEE